MAQSAPTAFNDDLDDASEHWVTIQRNTFANWVSEQLGARSVELGLRGSVDLQRDLCDGRVLCVLVEMLQQQRRRLTTARAPVNQHQCIDNINRALRAVADDGILLVNIGQFWVLPGPHGGDADHHRRRM